MENITVTVIVYPGQDMWYRAMLPYSILYIIHLVIVLCGGGGRTSSISNLYE